MRPLTTVAGYLLLPNGPSCVEFACSPLFLRGIPTPDTLVGQNMHIRDIRAH